MWIEVFKSGKHTDSKGNSREWTEADLDTIVAKYDPKTNEAPVVIGHPKENSPAWGWVESLKREGSVLMAKVKDLVPAFVDAWKAGQYKKRSISLNSDLSLRHIGFLGGMPPAVKGLGDVAFATDENAMTMEFSDWRISTIAHILGRMRDWIIDKFDMETADKVISSWDVENLMTDPGKDSAFSDNPKGGPMDKIAELQAALAQKETALAEFAQKTEASATEIATLKTEIANLKATISASEAKMRKSDFASFCEQLVTDGKLAPKNKTLVIDFMEVLHGAGEYEFAEGGKKPAIESFKAFLSGLPKVVEFGEAATGDNVGTSLDGSNPEQIAKAATEYREAQAKAGIEISFTDAVNHVTQKGGSK